MRQIETDLQKYIMEEVLPDSGRSQLDFHEELLDSGLVDSMGLLNILSFVQQHYDVDLLASGGPKDFKSIDSIAGAIRIAKGE